MLIVPLSASQERNLDWFPRMRAMSLVSSDAEGEQNELRNLQEKLESTMKLVTNLSGQLSELKDQVRARRLPRLGAGRRVREPLVQRGCSTAPWLLQAPGRTFLKELFFGKSKQTQCPPRAPCPSLAALTKPVQSSVAASRKRKLALKKKPRAEVDFNQSPLVQGACVSVVVVVLRWVLAL